jgi:hypothetical protein
MEQTLSKALRMFVYRVLPSPSRRHNIDMTQNDVEKKQLISNYTRATIYSRRCLLAFIGYVIVLHQNNIFSSFSIEKSIN